MIFHKYPVSEETQEWVLESFQWAIHRGILSKDTRLVLPTREFITAPKGKSPDTVRTLVDDIKKLLNIEAEKVEILPIEKVSVEHRHEYQILGEVAGTWQNDDGYALVRYDPEQATNPIPFISTLAHELMHHRLHMIHEFPPGGAEAEELSTDLHCVSAGFGIFQMAGAEQIGWQGYLRQPTRAHALALFLETTEISYELAFAHLPGRSRKALKLAQKHFRKNQGQIKRLKKALPESAAK